MCRKSTSVKKKRKVAHFLYLVDNTPRMLTEEEAAHIAFTTDSEVWNVHRALDMEPDFLLK